MKVKTKQIVVEGTKYLDICVTAHNDEVSNRDLHPEALEVVEWCQEAFGDPDAVYPYGDTEDFPVANWAYRDFNVPYTVRKLDWTGKALVTAYQMGHTIRLRIADQHALMFTLRWCDMA